MLPYGRSGIVGAILLGLGRALGETMAVTMVIGNRPEIAPSLFAPGYTMASVIANEFTEATCDLYLAALIEIGLVLFVVTVVVNALARLLVWSRRRTGRRRCASDAEGAAARVECPDVAGWPPPAAALRGAAAAPDLGVPPRGRAPRR